MILTNIGKMYEKRTVLDGIDIEFAKSKITFITGASGAGKTTLLYLLGLIEEPSYGSIIDDNADVSLMDPKSKSIYRSTHVNYIFQDNNLFTGLTVRENIKLILDLSGINYDHGSVTKMLNDFLLENIIEQKIETLSGGERQRLSILIAVLRNNDIILADEPTGSLDSVNSEIVYEKLAQIKNNKYVIIVSHNIDYAIKYGDRIITMKDGKIISDEMNTPQYSIHVDSSNKANEKKKKRLSSSDLHIIFKRNVRKRKSSFFASIFMLAFCMTLVAFLFSINNAVDNILTDVNVNYLETDLITVNHPFSFAYGGNLPLDNEDSSLFVSDPDFVQVTEIYSERLFLEDGTQIVQAKIRAVELNSFYVNRFKNNIVEGEFIVEAGQIVLAQDVCLDLFEGDCLGESLFLSDGSGSRIQMVVNGVNSQTNPLGDYESYVLNQDIKLLMDVYYQNMDYLEFFRGDKFDTNIVYGGVGTSYDFYTGLEDLLYGTYPSSENEILISTEAVLFFLHECGIDSSDITQDAIDAGLMDSKTVLGMFDTKLIVALNDLVDIHISGIYVNSDIEVLLQPNAETQFFSAKPIAFELFMNNTKNIESIKEDMISLSQFEVIFNYEYLQAGISGKTRILQYIVGFLSTLMGISGIIIINNYAKNKVENEKYDIGLLKMYGARKSDIFIVFIYDTLLIFGISFLLSLGLSVAITSLLPYLVDIFSGIPLRTDILIHFLILLVAILCGILSELKILTRATNMSIGEAIRTRD